MAVAETQKRQKKAETAATISRAHFALLREFFSGSMPTSLLYQMMFVQHVRIRLWRLRRRQTPFIIHVRFALCFVFKAATRKKK